MEEKQEETDATTRSNEDYPWNRSTLKAKQPFVMLLTRNERKYDVCQEDGTLTNKFGTFAYEDICGKPFGSQWVARTGKQKVVRGSAQRRRTQKGGPVKKTNSDAAVVSKKEEEGEDTVANTESVAPTEEGAVETEEKKAKAKEEEEEELPLSKRGKVAVLQCTPELWCRTLLHRTQIIYALDFSLICFHLDLKPGSVVAESGTGSGSLSLAMARAVAPNGKVFTYEFNASRVEAAKKDFALLFGENNNELITCQESDAYQEGFKNVDGRCDAVFLDLPKPWLALKNCVRALNPLVETRICCFSPCIEQVSRACQEMREMGGFHLIRTFEVVNRELETFRLQERVPGMWEDVHSLDQLKTQFDPSLVSGNTSVFPTMATHTGYLTFASRFPSPN